MRGFRLLTAAAAVLVPVAFASGAPAASSQANAHAVCPASPFAAHCQAYVVTDANGKPNATSSPSGYGPAQFHGAYNLPNTGAAGQVIGIVDAYDDPTVESDLGVYSSTFGIPACTTANGCFQKVDQRGGTAYPRKDAGWSLEIALDVETAHQICQNCKVLLVEADSNSFANLAAAVNEAAKLGATVISNSYGGSDTSSSNGGAYNHPGIAITASSGDNGYGVESPASYSTVVAVGGTSLKLGANNSYGSESVWSGAGSGCSSYWTAQSWQTLASGWAATGCGSKRGVADVAADADPNTGAAVYDSTRYQGQSGWFQVGGTSLSSPLIAAVYALAGNASSATYAASLPYGHTGSLHDVTSGSNGSCSTTMCKGASGYDGPTGVGTPNGTGAF
jgi:subtilase family serine protease